MESEILITLLREHLAPLLSANVSPDVVASTAQHQCFASKNPNTLEIKADRSDPYRVVLTRYPEFSPEDRKIARCFVDEIIESFGATNERYRLSLFKNLPIRAISRYLERCWVTTQILEQFDSWASQTYEGGRITSAIGVLPNDDGGDSEVSLNEIFDQDFSAVISNGFDTVITTNEVGRIRGAVQLQAATLDYEKCPYRLNMIACWCHSGRIVFVLNRLGEQLIFRDNEMLFAKRRGEWHLYSHEIYIKQLHPKNQERELREAIYASCLDISFARTGGCLIVVGDTSRLSDLLSDDDRIDVQPTNPKTKTIRAMISAPFQSLDRRLRQELLALDGATVIDRFGNVLAVGAILSVPAGSDGGGRRAAAMRGSEYGMGIKISEDGEISAFEDRNLRFRT